MTATWKGQDVTTLTREELLEALQWCGEEIKRLHVSHQRDYELLTSLRSRIERLEQSRPHRHPSIPPPSQDPGRVIRE